MCGWVLTSLSFLMVVITLPFSLCVCFKVGLAQRILLLIVHVLYYIATAIVCPPNLINKQTTSDLRSPV